MLDGRPAGNKLSTAFYNQIPQALYREAVYHGNELVKAHLAS